MPEEGIDFSHRDDILTYEEIVRLANIFCQLGVKKVRLTGGEPFARKDIGLLIHQLSQIFEDVRITTNATLLHHYYDILIASKIGGLNISLDSLLRWFFSFCQQLQ